MMCIFEIDARCCSFGRFSLQVCRPIFYAGHGPIFDASPITSRHTRRTQITRTRFIRVSVRWSTGIP